MCALVPFRASGPAAGDGSELRLLQFSHSGIHVRLQQQPQHSGATRRQLQADASITAAAMGAAADLSNVGLVVWQSAFVLADYLLRHPPFGSWVHVHTLELGAGTGACGVALALAGARLVMTDLPHITPLTRSNVLLNFSNGSAALTPVVLEHAWGQHADRLRSACGAAWAAFAGRSSSAATAVEERGNVPCDVVIGADLLYDPAQHMALLATLAQVCAQHTQAYLAYRHRGLGEERFQEAATAAGWALEAVPLQHLHEEYQDGAYRILRLVKLDLA